MQMCGEEKEKFLGFRANELLLEGISGQFFYFKLWQWKFLWGVGLL